jgi:hypothetical protein
MSESPDQQSEGAGKNGRSATDKQHPQALPVVWVSQADVIGGENCERNQQLQNVYLSLIWACILIRHSRSEENNSSP